MLGDSHSRVFIRAYLGAQAQMPIHMISQGDDAFSHMERIQVLKLHQFIAANEDEKLEPTLRIIEQQLLDEGKQMSDKEPRL